MKMIDMGNGEIVSIGIAEDYGQFLALTLTSSKTFKTRKGAERWLGSRGFAPNGGRRHAP